MLFRAQISSFHPLAGRLGSKVILSFVESGKSSVEGTNKQNQTKPVDRMAVNIHILSRRISMHLHGKYLSAESTIDLVKYLWRDFVAAVAFDGHHQARFLLAVEAQEVAARLFEF